MEKTEEINEKLGGADRKVALSELMDKEARLIAGAGRHWLKAEEQNSQDRVANYLQKVRSSSVFHMKIRGTYPNMKIWNCIGNVKDLNEAIFAFCALNLQWVMFQYTDHYSNFS